MLNKETFITNMNTKAGFNGLHLVHALSHFEWQKARHFRQAYFFDRIPVDDPYTWTFTNTNHIHFVLYKRINIIGYAHIQLWREHRAALQIIVIDEPYRNRGIGSDFIKLCEYWLLHNKTEKLLIESSPETYPFYCANGYVKMPFNDSDGYKTNKRNIEIGKNL